MVAGWLLFGCNSVAPDLQDSLHDTTLQRDLLNHYIRSMMTKRRLWYQIFVRNGKEISDSDHIIHHPCRSIWLSIVQ
ncbi:hypothetical protein AOLI_G00114440 [Acnodon oligacanthus]